MRNQPASLPVIRGLIEQIDENTREFVHEFSHLSKDELNWRRSASSWSIAQIIDHLITINESYFPVIRSVKNHSYKLPLLGRFPFITRAIGNMLLKSVQPNYDKKTKTFGIWEPSSSDISKDILMKFEKHHEELKKVIRECGDLLEKDRIISSPANRNIVYPLETAFQIIIAHERRHLKQAREVLNAIPH